MQKIWCCTYTCLLTAINQDIISIVFFEGFEHDYQNLLLLFSYWTKQYQLLSILFKNFQNNPVDRLFMRGIIFASSFLRSLYPHLILFSPIELDFYLISCIQNISNYTMRIFDVNMKHADLADIGGGHVGGGWRNNTIKRVQEMV